VSTDLRGADLTDCSIYGISAWGLNLEGVKQRNLVITRRDEPAITVSLARMQRGRFKRRGCGRTMVESTIRYSKSGSSDIASKIRHQTRLHAPLTEAPSRLDSRPAVQCNEGFCNAHEGQRSALTTNTASPPGHPQQGWNLLTLHVF